VTFRVAALAADPMLRQGRADTVPDGIGGYAYDGVPLERVPELSNKGAIGSIMDRLYPQALRASGVGGMVVVRFVVEADGTVNTRTAKLVSNTNADLVDPTLKALERFRFRPGRLAGRNVRTFVSMPVTWDPATPASAPVALNVTTTPAGAGAAATAAATAHPLNQAEETLLDQLASAARNREAAAPQRDDLREMLRRVQTPEKERIMERAKILVAQRYPSLLTETTGGAATLFVIVAPDGQVRDSWLVRRGEDFAWPAGTPTDFTRITTIREADLLMDFAPGLVGTGIMWFEL
jgi:TonB family protein